MSETLSLSGDVRAAAAEGRPLVALETSVLAQGLPPPRNLEAAHRMGAAIRDAGAEPAWVWVDQGAVRIGAGFPELQRLADPGAAMKVARRDLPAAVASGRLGATTVSATLWAAHHAGIDVMATGGIGGVHPGSGDVSADLFELARTPGTVVCSGPKSIVDPAATLERLEELGVSLLGYRCGLLPFFLVRQADLPLEHRVDTPLEAAATARARRALGIESALIVCNPIPSELALDPAEVVKEVDYCADRARSEGVTGKALTPFLLACLSERTGGRSLEANLAMLESNARLAGQIAVASA